MAVNLNALAPQKPEDVRVNTARDISAPLTPADVQGEVTQQDYNNLIRGRQLIQEKPPEEKSVDQQVAEALPGVEVKQTPEPEVEIIPEAEQAPNLPLSPVFLPHKPPLLILIKNSLIYLPITAIPTIRHYPQHFTD